MIKPKSVRELKHLAPISAVLVLLFTTWAIISGPPPVTARSSGKVGSVGAGEAGSSIFAAYEASMFMDSVDTSVGGIFADPNNATIANLISSEIGRGNYVRIQRYSVGFPLKWLYTYNCQQITRLSGSLIERSSDWSRATVLRYGEIPSDCIIIPTSISWTRCCVNYVITLICVSILSKIYRILWKIILGWNKGSESMCGACGYDLRGLPASIRVCPECGDSRLSQPPS